MSHHAKLIGSVVVTIVLAYVLPSMGGSPAMAAAAVLLAGIFYAVAAVRGLDRQEKLSETIGLELNKIRRIYHLSKNLSTDDTRLRQWFTDLHGYLYGYLTAFDGKDFSQYQEMNGAFRKLSYHLYEVPELQTEKQRVLYRDLLETAGVVAGARQRIQELRENGLPKAFWNTVVAVCVLAAVASYASITNADRLVIAATLASLSCAYAAVGAIDRLEFMPGKAMAKKYVENIARLELRHRDSE